MFNLDFAQFNIIGKTLALAVSGGRDSMSLLHSFIKNRVQPATVAPKNFFVVTVEHGIRGEASVKDAEFVSAYARKHGVDCKLFSANVPAEAAKTGETVEECARRMRYEIFRSLAESGECDAVVLAHNADDQAETVFMRILRGTGIKGLAGMYAVRDGIFLRPLLGVTRAEIDSYVKDEGVPYVEDGTNSDTRYMRNFIRGEIFPLIGTRYPDFKKSLLRLSATAAAATAYAEGAARRFEYDGESVYLPLETFSGDEFLSKVAVARTLLAAGAAKDVEDVHLTAVVKLAFAANGSRLDLPFGIKAYKEYDRIVFAKETPVNQAEIPILTNGSKNISKLTAFSLNRVYGFKMVDTDSYHSATAKKTHSPATVRGGSFIKDTLFFDADKLPDDAVIRGRRTGDRITKLGGGTKSLSDFLTDKKIPLRLRDTLAVIASNGDVLAVPGVDIGDKLKITDETQKIVRIYLKQAQNENGDKP
ncbi:MAG: tRNA lysidine(34) synthetase TilS [Clostridiaceae bacterium]|jgi:tRNA(Ile)-lysidine synthase|nr:tRNA lysidine(34) synthetase TilS [Clostridiaceae bacterium]